MVVTVLTPFCWLHTSQNSDDHRCSCSLVNNTTKTMRHAQDISRVLFCIALIAFIADRVADGHKSFQAKIPNGGKEIAGSKAIGHQNDIGGGTRNAFGKAFQNAGLKWSKELCEADSDGDGQTNGFELGDPDCCWNAGDTPRFTTELSHPGKNTSKSSRKPSRRLGGDDHDHDHDHNDGEKSENTCNSGSLIIPSFIQLLTVAIMLFLF